MKLLIVGIILIAAVTGSAVAALNWREGDTYSVSVREEHIYWCGFQSGARAASSWARSNVKLGPESQDCVDARKNAESVNIGLGVMPGTP